MYKQGEGGRAEKQRSSPCKMRLHEAKRCEARKRAEIEQGKRGGRPAEATNPQSKLVREELVAKQTVINQVCFLPDLSSTRSHISEDSVKKAANPT
jgi:hypothetical protein